MAQLLHPPTYTVHRIIVTVWLRGHSVGLGGSLDSLTSQHLYKTPILQQHPVWVVTVLDGPYIARSISHPSCVLAKSSFCEPLKTSTSTQIVTDNWDHGKGRAWLEGFQVVCKSAKTRLYSQSGETRPSLEGFDMWRVQLLLPVWLQRLHFAVGMMAGHMAESFVCHCVHRWMFRNQFHLPLGDQHCEGCTEWVGRLVSWKNTTAQAKPGEREFWVCCRLQWGQWTDEGAINFGDGKPAQAMFGGPMCCCHCCLEESLTSPSE